MPSEQAASQDVKPCPFCGGPATQAPADPKREGDAWYEISCRNTDCIAAASVRVYHEPPETREQMIARAIEAWNRRPAAQVPAEPECADCGHPESEHCRSGCMGPGGCYCSEFRAE